jgi:hypothetical protein
MFLPLVSADKGNGMNRIAPIHAKIMQLLVV